jgi:hypothetical protein
MVLGVCGGPRGAPHKALTPCAGARGQDPVATGFGGRKFDITGLDSNAYYCLLTSETQQARSQPRRAPSASQPAAPGGGLSPCSRGARSLG